MKHYHDRTHNTPIHIKNLKITTKSCVLDIGCGWGRLALGIIDTVGDVDYLGVDVMQRSIEECRTIEEEHPSFKFKHLNVCNARYNPTGDKITQLQFNKKFDIIYLCSVFTHMTEEDMRIYLRDFPQMLKKEGRIFFTVFVEDDVPNITINPDNYKIKCSGALHIVRYNKDYLFNIINEYDYKITDFSYGTEGDGQSAIYLKEELWNYFIRYGL